MLPKVLQYSVGQYSTNTGVSGYTFLLTSLFISMSFSSLESIRVVIPGILRSISRNRLLPLQMEFLSSNTAVMHNPNSSVYQASKAALSSIAKTAAAELASKGIRVNTISPGPIKTDILAKAGYDEESLKNIDAQVMNSIPLKKKGNAEDVAKMVAYFCGDEAGFITGAELIMDGGMSL